MGIFEIGSQKLFAQEMNQALYAHMNNKRKMKKKKLFAWAGLNHDPPLSAS
jgi:hypothetical protein